ncbi:DUF4315 family protein [Mediterraneibacter gnavus]|uniref:DUF4315 family protein n=1 Tax=Mediterraneibacter gnavus TaxID=33038 RepID=UPI003562BF3E
MNKKYKRYLDEIERTEAKIVELQEYLKTTKAALKQEEELEMVKAIRSMKLKGRDLFDILNQMQNGNVSFEISEEEVEEKETASSDVNETTVPRKALEREEKQDEYEEME